MFIPSIHYAKLLILAFMFVFQQIIVLVFKNDCLRDTWINKHILLFLDVCTHVSLTPRRQNRTYIHVL